MLSRYTYMSPSNVRDIDNEQFPDPLSVTYNDIQFSKIPEAVNVSAPILDKFWVFMWSLYGRVDMDDVLLNINGVPYIGYLKPGDIIFKVNEDDLDNFSSHKFRGGGN